jgi:hypothetical protein
LTWPWTSLTCSRAPYGRRRYTPRPSSASFTRGHDQIRSLDGVRQLGVLFIKTHARTAGCCRGVCCNCSGVQADCRRDTRGEITLGTPLQQAILNSLGEMGAPRSCRARHTCVPFARPFQGAVGGHALHSALVHPLRVNAGASLLHGHSSRSYWNGVLELIIRAQRF